MSKPELAAISRQLRTDFAFFVKMAFKTLRPGKRLKDNWHLYAICHQVERAAAGELTRLMITQPPRSLKSIVASVALPAFLLGRDPSVNIICASYSLDLAEKFAKDTRTILKSDWFKKAFPDFKIAGEAALDVTTTKGGGRLSTSITGGVTGRGGDIVIIDDPLKADEALSAERRQKVIEWYEGTVTSRLDDKNVGTIIIAMQRLHQGDLAGYLLGKSDRWHHLNLPAYTLVDRRIAISPTKFHHWRKGEPLHAGHESLELLEEIRDEMGVRAFAAQYLQNPTDLSGFTFKWDWFQRYDAPFPFGKQEVVLSVDPAQKIGERNDFSVITVWARRDKGERHILLEVVRAKLEYRELRQKILDLGAYYHASDVLIEDVGVGISLAQDLRYERSTFDVRPIKVIGDKPARFASSTLMIEKGQVWLPHEAPWMEVFQREMDAFPYGTHDDIVDSFSQYLNWAREKLRNEFRSVPITWG